jgi:hypothetical protein
MRRLREIPRLKQECGATDRAIARSLGIARSMVAVTLDRLAAAELRWPLPASLSNRVLEAMLYAGPGSHRGSRRKAEPDWTHVRHELCRPGVTLMLLWEEYRQAVNQRGSGTRDQRRIGTHTGVEKRSSPESMEGTRARRVVPSQATRRRAWGGAVGPGVDPQPRPPHARSSGHPYLIVCPPNTDVTVSAILKCHCRRGRRRAGAEPRRSAQLDRRPSHRRSKPHRLFYRAGVSPRGSQGSQPTLNRRASR